MLGQCAAEIEINRPVRSHHVHERRRQCRYDRMIRPQPLEHHDPGEQVTEDRQQRDTRNDRNAQQHRHGMDDAGERRKKQQHRGAESGVVSPSPRGKERQLSHVRSGLLGVNQIVDDVLTGKHAPGDQRQPHHQGHTDENEDRRPVAQGFGTVSCTSRWAGRDRAGCAHCHNPVSHRCRIEGCCHGLRTPDSRRAPLVANDLTRETSTGPSLTPRAGAHRVS